MIQGQSITNFPSHQRGQINIFFFLVLGRQNNLRLVDSSLRTKQIENIEKKICWAPNKKKSMASP